MSRSAIFLGDVAEALRALAPGDDATAAEIVRLLGIEPSQRASAPRETVVPPPDDNEPLPAPAPPPPEPSTVTESYRYIPSSLHSETLSPGPSAALRLPGHEPRLDVGPSEREEPRLPLAPLLRTSSARAILTASLSTEIVTGVDIEKALGVIARREPFDRLPLRAIRSLRRGVQLLVDKSAGMAPYFRDQAWLSAWIGRVVGRQRMELASFAGVPQRGLHHGLRRMRPYQLPPRRTPIILLTDLGIARPPSLDNAAGPAEWLAFASMARHAGCPVVAFVPYPRERWPRELSGMMHILRWDRQLTADRAAKGVTARR